MCKKASGRSPHAYHARRPQQLLAWSHLTPAGPGVIIMGEKRISSAIGLIMKSASLHDPQRVHFGMPKSEQVRQLNTLFFFSTSDCHDRGFRNPYREPNARHACYKPLGRNLSTHYDHRHRSRRAALFMFLPDPFRIEAQTARVNINWCFPENVQKRMASLLIPLSPLRAHFGSDRARSMFRASRIP